MTAKYSSRAHHNLMLTTIELKRTTGHCAAISHGQLLITGDRVWPLPILDVRHVVAIRVDILFVLEQLVAQMLLKMSADALQTWNAIDRVARQMKAVELV